MATAYFRFSGWWGTVEAYRTDEEIYTAAQRKPMGSTAVTPGIGVRRAQLVYTRAPSGSTEDVATTSIDFQNLTSDAPDDTWTAGDFTSLETMLNTWWTSLKPETATICTLKEVRWYRIGPGIEPPNPPVRITAIGGAGTGSGLLPPQCAISVTEKTAVRKSWGRIYLPMPKAGSCDSAGRVAAASRTAIADATHTLYSAAAAADFLPVVYSKTRGKVFSVEKLQVDDVFDVIRRRRWDRKIAAEVRP